MLPPVTPDGSGVAAYTMYNRVLRFPDLESAERTTAYRRLHAASPPRGALRSEVAMKSENDDLTARMRLLRESFGFTGRGGHKPSSSI